MYAPRQSPSWQRASALRPESCLHSHFCEPAANHNCLQRVRQPRACQGRQNSPGDSREVAWSRVGKEPSREIYDTAPQRSSVSYLVRSRSGNGCTGNRWGRRGDRLGSCHRNSRLQSLAHSPRLWQPPGKMSVTCQTQPQIYCHARGLLDELISQSVSIHLHLQG